MPTFKNLMMLILMIIIVSHDVFNSFMTEGKNILT